MAQGATAAALVPRDEMGEAGWDESQARRWARRDVGPVSRVACASDGDTSFWLEPARRWRRTWRPMWAPSEGARGGSLGAARPPGYLVVSRLFPSCLNQGGRREKAGHVGRAGLGIRGMYDGVRGVAVCVYIEPSRRPRRDGGRRRTSAFRALSVLYHHQAFISPSQPNNPNYRQNVVQQRGRDPTRRLPLGRRPRRRHRRARGSRGPGRPQRPKEEGQGPQGPEEEAGEEGGRGGRRGRGARGGRGGGRRGGRGGRGGEGRCRGRARGEGGKGRKGVRYLPAWDGRAGEGWARGVRGWRVRV
ncbi:hypothetical protein QBC39DRAFT_152680 [Podospora conica]|nr:hypothetical protein QBC39DRAFT_152680 [Schizothecium conicum]